MAAVVTKTDLYPSLLDACGRGDIISVQFFLSQGLNINYIDKEGRFPLLIASSFGRVEIVKYLLKCGAKVDLLNSLKEPFVFKGKEGELHEVVKVLEESGTEKKILPKTVTTPMWLATTGSLDTRLSIMNLQNLLRELGPKASQWQNIGTLLNISQDRLMTINYDHQGSCMDCLREVLATWLRQTDSPATWKKLIEAVEIIDPYRTEKLLKKYNS